MAFAKAGETGIGYSSMYYAAKNLASYSTQVTHAYLLASEERR
jgi:hypothetical protein